MNSPANHPQQRQFLEEIATHYSFTGDRRTVFLSRFDPVNLTKDNGVLVGVMGWNKEYEDKAQKLQDELKKICQVLKENGCPFEKPTRGRQLKGKSPWEQAFKWLWDKFPEWQQNFGRGARPCAPTRNMAVSLFLKNIEDKFNELYLLHRRNKPIVLKDQYIPIQVTLERKYNHLVEIIWSYSESETELKRVYALKGVEDKPTQVDWVEAKQQHQRIMVLADPGMGKSTLLKMEVGLIAQEAWHSLANNLTTIEDVTLPLLIRLSELAEATKELETEVIEAIPKLIKRKCKNFDEIKLILQEKLQKGQCILLLDALDEVPNDQRNRVSEKLNYFLDHHPCQIICTSRIVGYVGGFVDGGKDVEIVPFSQNQTEQYIETWFRNAAGFLSDETVSASELIQELRNKPQVGGLAQNPLLLSLICSLYQEKGLILPARRCEVYEKAVDYMLGKWSKNRNPEFDEAWVDAKAELLEELAYQFSCDGRDVFTLRELRYKIDKYLGSENVSSDFRDKKASQLITELSEQDGILQKLSREGDKYLFLHRTFQEYFTACYLQRNRDCVALAREHFWEYDWHETLSLLAGLMDQPMLLIRAIVDEKDDIFSTLLLLAGRCVAECRDISDDLIVGIIDGIYGLWEFDTYGDFIELIVEALAQVNSQMFQRLHTALNDSNKDLRMWATLRLAKIGNAQGIEALNTNFNYSDSTLRLLADWDLAKRDKSQAVTPLISALNDSDKAVRMKAAEALITALKDSDEALRWSAEEALGEISNPQAIEALILTLNNPDKFARMLTARALGKIGKPQALKALITALNDSDEEVRGNAAEALGEIGNPQAMAALIITLKDSSCYARMQAAEALGKIGKPEALDALIIALKDLDKFVRRRSADALAKIGKPEALDALIIALDDLDHSVRWSAAVALANIDNPQAMEALITALKDSHRSVRELAAIALAKIGTSETLAKLIQLPEINIYNPDIFLLARKLAIRFSGDNLPFIPVYPELVAHKL